MVVKTLGLLMVCFTGAAMLFAISSKFRKIEAIGLSWLLGLGGLSFVFFLCEVLNIPIALTSGFVGMALFSLGCLALGYFRNKEELQSWKFSEFFVLGSLNFIVLVAWAGIGYVLYAITAKCLFWPPATADALDAFETYSKLIAQEGTHFNSGIYESKIGPQIAYPPLYYHAVAWGHLLQFEFSKVINAVWFLSFAPALYALLGRLTNYTLSAVITFIVLITPEMLGQAAIAVTNVPQAIYASLGVLAVAVWDKNRHNSFLILGGILLGLSAWLRTEGVAFAGAGMLLVLYRSWQDKDWMRSLPFVGWSFGPFLVWQIFMVIHSDVYNNYKQVKVITAPFYDADKLDQITAGIWRNLITPQYYGFTLNAFFLALAVGLVWWFLKQKNNGKPMQGWTIASMTIIGLVAYMFLLYQTQLLVDSLANIMQYSAKRFMFGYTTLAWVFVASIAPVTLLFDKIEDWLKIPTVQK